MKLNTSRALFLWNCAALVCGLSLLALTARAAESVAEQPSSAHAQWKDGPLSDPSFFPIAVWLQSTRNAARYRLAGINVYVGLWRGPTTNQLAELQTAGMKLICGQNRVALEQRDSPMIIGWMHGDEPDNAQSLGPGKGYGPPILPEKIVRDYERIRTADPPRPVLLNLGQGVAWDNYIGRGVRRNHPEDYPEYIRGCDIASFDIYPVVHDAPEVAGKLEFVGKGVERLIGWARGQKIVWNCVECTHISNPVIKASPDQIRAEVWMSLIHGSRGLIYFVHQFKPSFNEAALLDDPEVLKAVTSINRQIHELAVVLNSPSIQGEVQVRVNGSNPAPPQLVPGSIAWMHKRQGSSSYVLSVNMRNEPARAFFAMGGHPAARRAQVLGEQRVLAVAKGEFADEFKPYEVHLYSIE